MSDEVILSRLLALNLERAKEKQNVMFLLLSWTMS